MYHINFVELWLEWIKDEVALVSESDERNSVLNLFERAVKDYIGNLISLFCTMHISL